MANTYAAARSYLLFDSSELAYDFEGDHPFQSARLAALMDLLEKSGLWRQDSAEKHLPFRAATREELELVHTPDYITAVQQLSAFGADLSLSPSLVRSQERLAAVYGFGEGDTPSFAGMHEAAAGIAGGSLVALSAIMGLPEGGSFAPEDERPLHVFHPAGGLHHAWAERASGFCIYNDIAVAITHLLSAREAKVLYIDFDAHHGDGVQRAFYDEPRVMTISLHETGRYLFPGTGDVLELGNGLARGYSINVPLEPFTEDDSYIEIMKAIVPPLVLAFAPDVIVSQHGCDSHDWDPLTHLSLSLRSIQAQMQLAHELAHTYCQGRWLALGGGGYDLYRVVPRAWSILWAEMSEQPLPPSLPEEWIARWQPRWQAMKEQEKLEQEAMGRMLTPMHFPTTFQDAPEDFSPQPRRSIISRTNRETVRLLRHLVLSPPLRHVFPAIHRHSPLEDIFEQLHQRSDATPSQIKAVATPHGMIFLRNFCPPSLVERLHVESSMHAFARLPEREHELLISIAKSPDCALTLAHTSDGEIVGEVTIAPGDEWFEGVEQLYEVTIEVSPRWRGQHLAEQLLAFALQFDALEDVILFAMGLSWHWDTEGLKISVPRYRRLIARLFGSQGFQEYETTEPDISMEPGNILLARIGKQVDQEIVKRFLSKLTAPPKRW